MVNGTSPTPNIHPSPIKIGRGAEGGGGEGEDCLLKGGKANMKRKNRGGKNPKDGILHPVSSGKAEMTIQKRGKMKRERENKEKK